jgi:hypothetical protein
MEEYLKVMEDVVKPWMHHLAARCYYVFHQHGTSPYNSKWTQEWLKVKLREKEIWPPSSPDCNPLNYCVWSVAELQVKKTS